LTSSARTSPSTPQLPHSDATPIDEPRERPTRVRYGVLAFLATMTFVLYLDRVCISKAGPRIQEDLRISNRAMGFIYAAFTLSYAVFEIPTGRWGDRFGSRGVLTRIVLWWSFFTALTGSAVGFWMLLSVRFLFGAGEAGALPNSARVLRAWFPESSRGRAQGFVTTAMMAGGAIAPVASQYLIDFVGWRFSFAVFGLLGLSWALAFYLWFRDDPSEHPITNEAERVLIAAGRKSKETSPVDDEALAPDVVRDTDAHGPIPWNQVLPCASIWLLGGAMVTMTAIYYMLISWYPTYLENARHVTPTGSGWLATMVLSAGAIGCLFAGWFTDWLVARTGDRRWGRTAQAVCGAGLAASGILASIWTESTLVASIFVSLACFGVQLQVPAWWASATQVSGRHLGALFGMMNMIGAAGGIFSQVFLGYFADWMKGLGYTGRAQWDPGLYLYVAVALVGMLLWSLVNPTMTVDGPEKRSAEPCGTC
jgi:ACS family glucarate transporter-like MFS transporter